MPTCSCLHKMLIFTMYLVPERISNHVPMPWSIILVIERKMVQNEIHENCDLKTKNKRTKTKWNETRVQMKRNNSVSFDTNAWCWGFAYGIRCNKTIYEVFLTCFRISNWNESNDENHIRLNIAISIVWTINGLDQNMHIFLNY